MTTIEASPPESASDPYPEEALALDLRWWAAANYLTAAQIYLRDNPLLREPPEHGSTTTPFDMVVLNRMSRYHLVLEALRRSRRVPEGGDRLARLCSDRLDRHSARVVEALEDLPEVQSWTRAHPDRLGAEEGR
jgi:phosphoketolase